MSRGGEWYDMFINILHTNERFRMEFIDKAVKTRLNNIGIYWSPVVHDVTITHAEEIIQQHSGTSFSMWIRFYVSIEAVRFVDGDERKIKTYNFVLSERYINDILRSWVINGSIDTSDFSIGVNGVIDYNVFSRARRDISNLIR